MKTGYYIHDAAGHQTENLMLDCSQPADCAGVTFELRRGGVVTGRVVDEYGEPVQDVRVRILRPGQAPDLPTSYRYADWADDRGMFRVAGIQPGRYVVGTRGPRVAPSRLTSRGRNRAGASHSRGELAASTVEVDVRSGEERTGIQLTFSRNAERLRFFKVSGKVTGVDLTKPGIHVLRMRSHGMFRGGSRPTRIGPDGSFLFDNAPLGEASFFYINPDTSSGRAMGDSPQIQMGRVVVERDIQDLLLHPQPATGFRGKITFEGEPLERDLSLWFRIDDTATKRRVTASAPDYTFELNSLGPGAYRVSVPGRGPRPVFVKGIRRGGKLEPPNSVEALEGEIQEIEVVLSGEYSRVHGRVKAGREEGRVITGGQYIVGLKSHDGVRSAQADQHGRFSFDQVPPGDYRVCAWPLLRSGEIRDDQTWKAAGSAARSFPVEAGSDIEIDLTAVQ